jgi:hypothetical protein
LRASVRNAAARSAGVSAPARYIVLQTWGHL